MLSSLDPQGLHHNDVTFNKHEPYFHLSTPYFQGKNLKEDRGLNIGITSPPVNSSSMPSHHTQVDPMGDVTSQEERHQLASPQTTELQV